MERQGRSYIGFQIFPGSIFLGVVLAVLLLFVSGWGACQTGSFTVDVWSGYQSGWLTEGGCNGQANTCWVRASAFCEKNVTVSDGRYGNCKMGEFAFYGGSPNYCPSFNTYCTSCDGTMQINRAKCGLRCDTKCETDSTVCVNGGNAWRDDASASCGKSCQEPCNCDDYQANCESLNGEFLGNCANANPEGGQCCVATCYLCNTEASQKQQEMAKRVCCANGMVPPKLSDYCFNVPPPGKCGMNYSNVRNDFDSQWKCRELDENSSQEMINWYREACIESSSSAAESSPSSGASSGGDGFSSSGGSQYPEGCDECPWLDSILDTLTLQKWTVDDIYACVSNPTLCWGQDQEADIDTSILPYIRPFMDSSVALSQEQLRMLVDLDTNILKILAEIKDLPQSDTAVKLAVDAMSSNIEGKLTTVNTSVVNMNDSTKKWLRRLADSLHVLNDSNRTYIERLADKVGISTDSLLTHLDSIKERIPSAVLDSILKYQKLAAESSDSIVLGDLPSIDSLIDSTVRYWKELREYDSVHHAKISDSLGSLHDAIDDISWRMGVIMGYGDTASSNLRGDINAVEGAVNVFRDSSLYYWRQSLSSDSAYRVQFGDGVTTISGAVSGVQGAVEGLGSTLGSIDGKLDGVAVDTNVDYGILREGNALRDTILDETGLGRISFGDDTTAYLQAESAQYDCVGDSCCVGSDCVYVGNDQQVRDSFMQVMSAYADTIRMKNEAVKQDSFTSYVSQLMDSVTSWNPLGAFDSTILSTLGSRMPNSNTCPEDCFVNDVTIPFAFGPIPLTINYGLCTPRAPLANGNVLSFLRFLIRLFVAIACVYTIMWNAAGRKGG